jgi:hypothetical protein
MPAQKSAQPRTKLTLAGIATSDERILFRDFGDENGDLVIALGFRLFINGVDVSRHVLAGSISFGQTPRGSEAELSFTLDNNNSKFELRPTNMGLDPRQYKLGTVIPEGGMPNASQAFADSESFATSEPWEITKMARAQAKGGKVEATYIASKMAHAHGLTTFSENEKRELYLGKLKQRAKVLESTTEAAQMQLKSSIDPNTGVIGEATLKDDISLYEGMFATKSCVININDQVRLFVPDPNRDEPDKSKTLWICKYTGFVNSASPEHDFTSGQSTIPVSCSDIRTQLKRKRVLVNATSADQITPNIGQNSGLFADLKVSNNSTSNAFADSSFTFESLTAFVLTGHRLSADTKLKQLCCQHDQSLVHPPQNYLMAQASQGTDNAQGFGQIWFGHYFEYDTSLNQSKRDRAAFLNKWNRLCVFGPTQRYLTWDGMMTMGRGTVRGGDFDALKVFVHWLVPTGGGQVSNLLDRAFIDQMGVQREYMSVQEIIDQVCERIDYQLTVTGSGDLVFEFPMYDFLPEDMGEEFKAVFAVSDSVKSHTLNDESNSNPVTGLRVVGGYSDSTAGTPPSDEKVKALQYTAYIVHELLAYRYGPVIEDYAIPSVLNGPSNQRGDDEYRRLLTVFGVIEFLKRLSEMSSMTIDSIYNPFVLPNRPYYYNYGRRLGYTEAIQTTLSLFSNADTNVSTKYIRRVDDLTGKLIAFSGSKMHSIPLKYSDKNTLDVWTSPALFEGFKNDLYAAGIDILEPNNKPAHTNADGSVTPGAAGLSRSRRTTAEKRACAWTQDDKAKLDALATKLGANKAELLAIIMHEGDLDISAVNKFTGHLRDANGKFVLNENGKKISTYYGDGRGGKSIPTFAMGLNQMLPSSIYSTLKNTPSLLLTYPAASALLDPRFYKKDRDGNMNVPVNMREEFTNIYMSVFGTTGAQLDMYGAFLDNVRRNAGLPEDYKFDKIEKISVAQIHPTKKAMAAGYYQLSPEEQALNPGIKDTNDYANRVRSQYLARAKKILQDDCSSTSSTSAQPAQTNAVGGAGAGKPDPSMARYNAMFPSGTTVPPATSAGAPKPAYTPPKLGTTFII